MKLIDGVLRERGIATWFDVQDILPGSFTKDAILEGLDASDVVLALIGPDTASSMQLDELKTALARSKRVIPVLIDGAHFEHLPGPLKDIYALQLRPDAMSADLEALADAMMRVLERAETQQALGEDVADPQKGSWGGKAAAGGRVLRAQVKELPGTLYCEVKLSVAANARGEPLSGNVVFHLHPTFQPSVLQVPVAEGIAELQIMAWGAFTVGAEADGGDTRLELDLSQDPSFPAGFRAR